MRGCECDGKTVRQRKGSRICVCAWCIFLDWGEGRGDRDTFIRIGALQTTIGGASALGRVMLAARHLEIPRVYRRLVSCFSSLILSPFLHVIEVTSNPSQAPPVSLGALLSCSYPVVVFNHSPDREHRLDRKRKSSLSCCAYCLFACFLGRTCVHCYSQEEASILFRSCMCASINSQVPETRRFT